MMVFWLALAAVGSLALGVGALAGWLLMTYPGLGGQQPPPQNASPAGQLVPGVTPGVTGRIITDLAIIVSGGASTGLFVYNGTPALGNPPVFAVVAPGVSHDPFGNTVSPILNIGNLAAQHVGFDANGVEYLSDGTGTTRILLDPQNRVIEFYDSSGTGVNPPLLTAASAAGNDRFTGDAFQAGFTAYAAGGFPFTQLESGQIQAQATSGQFAPSIIQTAGVAGEIAISSGEATNTDNPCNIIVDSAQASGVGVSVIALQSTQTTLNTFATSNVPSSNTFPGLQGSSPAAYSQSFDQGNVNRINEILNVLTQTGIWHT